MSEEASATRAEDEEVLRIGEEGDDGEDDDDDLPDVVRRSRKRTKKKRKRAAAPPAKRVRLSRYIEEEAEVGGEDDDEYDDDDLGFDVGGDEADDEEARLARIAAREAMSSANARRPAIGNLDLGQEVAAIAAGVEERHRWAAGSGVAARDA